MLSYSKNIQNIFVINTIGRSPNSVVPFKVLPLSEWTYHKGITDEHEYPYSPVNGIDPKAYDGMIRDEYPVIKDDREPKVGYQDDDYTEEIAARDVFYSDLCRLTCTEETKMSIANHMSLWRFIIQNSDSMPEYVIIMEDVNTVNNETFLTNIDNIIAVLKENNIDMLQLITHNKIMKDRKFKRIEILPGLDIYKGGLDISLTAYIIRQDAIKKLYNYFSNNKPSLDMTLEIIKLEKTLDINRYVMDNDSFIRYDYKLKNAYRNSTKNKSSVKSRIDNWIMNNYPSFYNKMYTPLFSVFGKYDVTMLLLVAIVVIIGLAIFDVNNKFVWLLSGIFFSYSLN